MSDLRKELNEQYKELYGRAPHGGMSDEKVQAKIDKKLSEDEPKGKTYAPAGKGRVEICSVEIEVGFAPSEALEKNERFMSKFNRAIECGLIHELAK